MTTLEIKQ